MKYCYIFLIALFLFPTNSFCDTSKTVWAKDFFVLKKLPSDSAYGILGVSKGMKLTIIDEKNGYYHLKREGGGEGWSKRNNISFENVDVPKITRFVHTPPKNPRLVQGKNKFLTIDVEVITNREFIIKFLNTSSRPIHVNPNHFTLINGSNESLHYKSSDNIMVDLQPGTTKRGVIAFDNSYSARTLVYDNMVTGRMTIQLPVVQ